jgi:nitrite reductase (NO-forming)
MERDVEHRRRGRVAGAHGIAASAFRLGGVFALIAAVWAVLVAFQGGSWWGPLHSFLAGTLLLAISGASQMFTVTWAAAVPPAPALATTQRWAIASGVGAALIGMAGGIEWLVGVGAVVAVAGVVLLAVSLLGAVRRSLLRRFDLSARFYMLAIAAGVSGITLGGIMGSGLAGSWYDEFRLVHSHLNLLGLVGLTIVGTLPTILPTLAHHRAVSGREAVAAWWTAVVAMAAVAFGLVAGEPSVGVGTLLVAVALGLILGGVLGRLGRRGLKGGLPYGQVAAGSVWLMAWALVDGYRLITNGAPDPYPVWNGAVVVAGLAQILLGSLAYLVPVLVGPPPRLGRNLSRMKGRPWRPLLLANLAGVLFLFAPAWAAIAAGIWITDFAIRLLRLEWRDRAGEATPTI